MIVNKLCPCGSQQPYAACCGPYHRGERSAPTAAALMRSRFCAFALGLSDYLLTTWDASTRPTSLDLSKDATTWEKLIIIATQQGDIDDATGTVEFQAYYSLEGKAFYLWENSRFVKQGDHWQYVDGQIKAHAPIARATQGRNEACACGSGKKFKRCCGAA